MTAGYFRFPTISGERVVFVSEDDLWEVSIHGGRASRLTNGLGRASAPVFSPDGSKIAFTGSEEGSSEVFVINARGGPSKQLTYHGSACLTVGWTADGEDILFRSNHGQHTPRNTVLFQVSSDGGEAAELPYGPAHTIEFETGGDGVVLARHADDLARWKRYQGGLAGVIWMSRDGESWEKLFTDSNAGHVAPMWIGERLYFLSDREGYGNLYSSALDGSDLKRETHHTGFYVRFPSHDGQHIIYTCGASIWLFDTRSGTARELEVDYVSPQTQMNRKFADTEFFLDDLAIHPKGHSLAVVARGQLSSFGLWEGGVRHMGVEQGVRYECPIWLDDTRILVTSDESGEVAFEIHSSDSLEPKQVIETSDIGRPLELIKSPADNRIAFTNHRHEIAILDLDTNTLEIVDSSPWERIQGFDWSADGRYLAYSTHESPQTSVIKIRDTKTGETHNATTGEFKDVAPCFDPKGRYLYFLSYRFFEPIYDQLFFEISFPQAMKPCLLTLQADTNSPFFEEPRPLEGEDEEDGEEDGEEEEEAENAKKEDEAAKSEAEEKESLEIEFEELQTRIEAFPVPTGEYLQLSATEDRVFWAYQPGGERLAHERHKPRVVIQYFVLKEREMKTFARGVLGFILGAGLKTIAVWGEGLRVASASSGGVEDLAEEEHANRKTGWIDLDRVLVNVDRRAEWRQMLREAWRLMRDHFWSETMAGLDWDAIWDLYSPLVERVGSRTEFSELVWTMQGELGTSHAYEIGGDYRQSPRYLPGFLGADLSWDPTVEAYKIDRIVKGDTWSTKAGSPLMRPGAQIREGDHILAINGRVLKEQDSIQARLVNLAGREVELVVRAGSEDPRAVTVRTLMSEFGSRYRDWVNENRRLVHEATDGQVGYVHVPDMSAQGFAEFHRGFLTEIRRPALIVDVRFNGGGHVSQLLLEKLARQRIGYDVTRWGGAIPYPADSVAGPIVALTDERAGSDGDIFSHGFKLMKVGTLVGKRTWGGVVGIWPRHPLVDGSITTQPEFSYWFTDVGFGVENFGTEPDIDVEIPPDAHARGEDPQLQKAIEVISAQLAASDVKLPDFGEPPNLRPAQNLPDK